MYKIILKLFIVFITFHLVEIVTSRDAQPIIIPDQGIVMGTFLKMFRTQNIRAYLGIPYAHPPINYRRFAPPVVENPPSWDGVRNATFFQPDCWQNPSRPLRKHDELFAKIIKSARRDETRRYSEDCLYLNIFIPDAPPPMEGYSVVAWIHSGDFSFGSPADLDPFQLVFKQKLIVVTIAYRLNIFGFLTTMDGESPGNYGLMDQAAGLLWIRRNIKLFFGNDNSITIMGQGAGAVSVGLQLTSGEWTDGLFHKAIIMSGSPLSEYSVRSPGEYATVVDAIATSFGCIRRPSSKLMECLRSIDPQILSDNLPYIEWGPIVDGGLSNSTAPFIADYPKELIERGAFRHVPLLIGYTDMEDVLDIIIGDMMTEGIQSDIYDTLITDIILNDLSHLESNDTSVKQWCGNIQIVIDATLYTYKPYPIEKNPMKLRKMFIDFNTERKYIAPSLFLADAMSKHAPTYMYRFDIKTQTAAARSEIDEWIGVPHNFDQIFIWGIPYWSNANLAKPWDTNDKRAADIIMTLWANFARFSDPTKTGLYIKWDNFTETDPKILIIDRAFNMSGAMNFKSIHFWNDYFPKTVQHATNCCNASSLAPTIHNYLKPNSYTLIVSATFIVPLVELEIRLHYGNLFT